MAGRGGRGAALLKALDEPARRPGALSQASAAPPRDEPKPPAPPVAGTAPKPSGRGSYLLSMIPQKTEQQIPALAPVQSQPTPPQTKTNRPTARGAGLLKMAGPSPPRPKPPIGPVKPLTTQTPQTQTHREDRTSKFDTDISSLTESMSDIKIPPREKGTAGERIPLTSNYIKIRARSNFWYQYSVSFSPNVDSRGLRFRLLYTHEDVIGQARIFDGNVLFLPCELGSKAMTLFSKNPYADVEVKITVNLVKKISISSKQCIQMYNILFKRIMNLLNLVQIGRSASYDQKSAISIPQHKLQVWPGHVTAIDKYEDGLMLICDTSHKVLREETAYDLMYSIHRNQSISGDRKQDAMMKQLIGSSIITRYNNKTYRIDDVSFDLNPASTFDRREGPISYIEYYSKQYGIKIKDPKQPMLISRPKQRDRQTGEKVERLLCIIPELAHMTGLTDAMTANFKVMKDIAAYTRVTPAQRQISLRKLLHNIRQNEQALAQLNMWGLELANDSIQIEGRHLNPETVILANRNRRTGQLEPVECSAGPQADWTRGVANNSVINAVDVQNWLLVFSQNTMKTVMLYVNQYKKIGPQLGIQIADPQTVKLDDDRTDGYIRAIRERIHDRLQLVVVVFPTKREDKYNAVKKLLCAESPCPSQIIISKTIDKDERKLRSVVQKISLQINAKLGGELWQLKMPLKNTMYVGIDVYHDGAKGKAQSVAALVASLNAAGTRYFSRVSMQSQREELIGGLKVNFLAALHKYHSIHNVLPDKVVVYRDGVGDSMMEVVTQTEVTQLTSCFKSFSNYEPGLAFVIVQKRISTRICKVKGQVIENAPPGTVLDHSIVKSNLGDGRWFDYYIVSQHVTQGTVTPTHYVCVYDTTSIKTDHIQQLTYKMCHLYYNWSGTVRVPAPCQYAHKLAYLVGENVRKIPSQLLEDKLYYL